MMGYSEPLARIVEWPRENGNTVRALRAASKAHHRPRVRVRVRLRRPKVHRSNNGALSANRSQQEMERPESASPQSTPSSSPDHGQCRRTRLRPECLPKVREANK